MTWRGSPGRSVVWTSILGAAAGIGACTPIEVDLDGRPCKDGVCVDGYVCNPINDRCGRWVDATCDGEGICPSEVETGSPCWEPGTFTACKEEAAGCESQCRTCLDNGRWSDCEDPDCDLGRPASCASCDQDCTETVRNAPATCDGPPYRCGYSACDPGYVDADNNRTNGCECRTVCAGLCDGADGCGGTCPDTCVTPESCGGGGVANECGCTPSCAGLCDGADGCGGTCPDTCVTPESCGGGGATNECGCTPDCAGLCAGPDGCGGTCPDTCPEDQICGAVTENECGCCADWWHCGYAGRTLLGVQAADALPAGYSIPVTFDHADSVRLGETLASGDDLRVVYWTGSGWVELDRVLDPESSWGSMFTTIWFPLYRAIAAGDHDDYQIYTTNPSPSPPPADENRVFAFADFFDRAGDLGDSDGWSVTEGADIGTIDIVNGALAFTQTSEDHYCRPLAQRGFVPLTGGFHFRTSVTWDRPGTDTDYWLFIELGQADAMYTPVDTDSELLGTAGVGPAPAYGGGMVDTDFHYGFGLHDDETALAQYDAPASQSLFSAVGSTASHAYNLYVNGARISYPTVPFADGEISQLDRIRIMAWSNASGGANDKRRLDYVLLRQTVAHGPEVSFRAEEARPCP